MPEEGTRDQHIAGEDQGSKKGIALDTEALYHNLVDTMSETVSLNQILYDESGKPSDILVLDVNPAWSRAFGYPRDEVIGKRASVVTKWNPPPYLEQYASVAAGGPPLLFDAYNPHFQRHALMSVTSPRPGYFVVVATDITERVKTEQQLERALRDLTAKGQELESLLYVTTHDLRSPLVNIQGFSARIERGLGELTRIVEGDDDAPAFTREAIAAIGKRLDGALKYIASSAQKMDRLINGLLRLSRLGRSPLQWTDVSMQALWKQVLTVFSHQVRAAGIQINTGELPPCRGDPGQLDQVLSNLLDNAIKYRDPTRACSVTFSGSLDAAGFVVYRFEDTGRGIASEHIDRIWELFHRLAPSEDLPGDGIGLTAVTQIITRHGGEISVQSQVGVGSVFVFRLPVIAPPQSTIT